MELKTQIQLVILIPILLILILADFQVAMLGFVSIPSFQDSLLEFHINRHLNGLIIENNILQQVHQHLYLFIQEIFTKYQSYFNQIFALTAHLRYYAFGEFQNESASPENISVLNKNNFLSQLDLNSSSTIDWYHINYTSLEEMKSHDTQEYFKLIKAVQSIGLADIIINNSITLFDDLDIDEAVRQQLLAEQIVQNLQTINYEFIEIYCSDSLIVRYPRYEQFNLLYHYTRLNKEQIDFLNQDFSAYYNNSIFQNAPITPDNTLVYLQSLNFFRTSHYLIHKTMLSRVIMDFQLHNTQIQIDPITNVKCFTKVKFLNNYLDLLNAWHNEQTKDYDVINDLFISLIDSNKTTLIPISSVDQNRQLSSSLFDFILNQTSLSVDPINQRKETMILDNQLNQFIAMIQSNQSLERQFIYQYKDFDVYLILTIVDLKSTKKVSNVFSFVLQFDVIFDLDTDIKYLHINPEGNDYEVPSFIICHCFVKQVLVDLLYQGSSLNNIQVLEIIICIVIFVLSISNHIYATYLVILILVKFIATRIGLSFEQPIKLLTNFMNSIDIQNMEQQDEELMAYEHFFNSFEISALFKTMNIFITTIKFSNQKFSNSKQSDAIALMELSRAKDFYKKEIGNMSALGICANNISVLHMKGQRVFEAVNEIEEAIYIGKQELLEIKEQKKWCKKMIAALSEPNFYQNFKQKFLNLANKFKQFEFSWITRLQRRKSDTVKSRLKSSNKNVIVKPNSQISKNISMTQMNIVKNIVPVVFASRPSIQNNNMLSRKRSIILLAEQMSSTSKNIRSQAEQSMKNDNLRTGKLVSPNYSAVQSYRQDLKESVLSESIRQYISNDIEQTDQLVQSDHNLFEEELVELQNKKLIIKAKLQNRQFQLAQFMFNICMQYSDVFIPETLSLFEQFEADSDKFPITSQSAQIRLIILYMKKALCYIQMGDIQKFKIEQKRAEESFSRLKFSTLEQKPDQDENFNFVDLFKNVPNEILQAKILRLSAIHELIQGNFQSSAKILTEIIDLGDYYDPEVRDFCLVLLEIIFKIFNMPTKDFKLFRSQLNIKIYEVVVLIDYSKEMVAEQIKISHSIASKIFGILQPSDLIGLYAFNNQLHESFPLQPKGIYEELLKKQMLKTITARGGSSRLYKSIKFAVKNFFEHSVDFSMEFKKRGVDPDQVNQEGKVGSALMSQKKVPGYRDITIELVQTNQNLKSERSSSDDSDFEFLENLSFKTKKQSSHNEFATRYKFICLFTQINSHPSVSQQKILQRLLLENQVDLMVFNIASQNDKMIDLKQLASITPKSVFISANTDLESIFGKSRQKHLQKKMYLEFF